MRELIFERPHTLSWREAPDPDLGADHEALVRPIAASTCDVDQAVIRGASPFEGPFAIGHECVARVVEIGSAVRGLSVGQVVSVPYHRCCGDCAACAAELPLHCERLSKGMIPSYGFPHAGTWGGMFADLVRVPYADYALVPLPQGVDPLAAVSAGDNLSDTWSTTVPHIRARRDARVLILGQGGYGLYAVQWSVAAGAASVTFVDDDGGRLACAETQGARAVPFSDVASLTRGYDVVVNARAGAEPLQCALRLAAPGAVCENVVIFFEDVALPLFAMHYSGVHFHSSYCHARTFMPQVLDELARGTINPRLVESELVRWEDAAEALAEPSSKPVFWRQ